MLQFSFSRPIMSSMSTGFVLRLTRSAPFLASEKSQRFTPTECNNTEEYGNYLRGFSQNINTRSRQAAVAQ
jgi:hypothetical protein